jgi:hypothetical protein
VNQSPSKPTVSNSILISLGITFEFGLQFATDNISISKLDEDSSDCSQTQTLQVGTNPFKDSSFLSALNKPNLNSVVNGLLNQETQVIPIATEATLIIPRPKIKHLKSVEDQTQIIPQKQILIQTDSENESDQPVLKQSSREACKEHSQDSLTGLFSDKGGKDQDQKPAKVKNTRS